MKSSSWDILWIVVAFVLCFLAIFFLVYSTISYWELKSVINKCNSDFGYENWTFAETSNSYICISHNIETQVISSYSQSCTRNGIPINCSEIGTEAQG